MRDNGYVFGCFRFDDEIYRSDKFFDQILVVNRVRILNFEYLFSGFRKSCAFAKVDSSFISDKKPIV